MAVVNVSLIGLDRRSVSLALMLKEYSKRPGASHQLASPVNDDHGDEIEPASNLGAVDHDVQDRMTAVQNANLVVVAVPYHTVKDVFRNIGPTLMPGSVVLDLSPLKVPSIQWADDYFRRASDGRFEAYLIRAALLPGLDFMVDPRTDASSAQANHFQHGKLVLSPSVSCPPEAIQFVSDLSALLGLKVHFTDPAEHDGIIAAMESLPLLMQMALFQTANGNPAWEDYQQLASSSFALGTYRLASDSPDSSALLASENRANSLRALENLISKLQDIRGLLATSDPEPLAQGFASASERYEAWLTKHHATSGPNDGLHIAGRAGPRLFGALSSLAPFGRKKT